MKNSIKKTISIAFSVLFVITCYMSTLMTANAVNESADSNTFNYINRLVDFDTYTPTEGNYWGDPTTWAYSTDGSITWSIADGVLKYAKDASGNNWNCIWNDYAFYNIMKLNETGANLNSDAGTIKLTPGAIYNVSVRLNLNLTNKSANEDIGLYLGVGTSDKLSDNVTTADGNWTCTINGGMLLDRFSASTEGWVNKTYKITVPEDAGEGGLLLGITPISNTGDGSTFSAYTYSCFELDIDSVRIYSESYKIGFENYTPTEGNYWNYPTTWAYSSDGSITWSVADGVLKYTKDASGNNWNCVLKDWAFYNIMKLNETGANLNTDAGTFKLVPGATYNVSVRLNLNLTNKNANEDIGLYLGVGTSDKLSDNVTTADGNWTCTIDGGMLLDRFSASTDGWVDKTYKITVPEDAAEGGLLLGITPIANTGDGSTFSAYTYSCFELCIDDVQIDRCEKVVVTAIYPDGKQNGKTLFGIPGTTVNPDGVNIYEYYNNYDASAEYNKLTGIVNTDNGIYTFEANADINNLYYSRDYDIGDIDKDFGISGTDLSSLKKVLLGIQTVETKYADCYKDGSVNILDLVRLKEYLAGYEGVTLG